MGFFLVLFCFFDDPVNVGNLISCSSAFSKTSLNIWKFTVQVLLKWQEETNIKYQISFPSLYKIKRRLLLKFCVANTCFYLNLTFLKPSANQCIFLMEIFVLSYVNELCIYPRLWLSSKSVCLRLRTGLDKPVCFTHTIVLLICVNETMYLLGNLPFFKVHVIHFMARDDSPCTNVISKYMLWVRDLVPLLSFETFPFSN